MHLFPAQPLVDTLFKVIFSEEIYVYIMQNVKHLLRYNTVYCTSSIFFKIFILQNYYHHSFGPPTHLPLCAENYLLGYLTEIFLWILSVSLSSARLQIY